jgi:hypothetical protein
MDQNKKSFLLSCSNALLPFLGAVCIVLVFYFNRGESALAFRQITPESFAGLIGWLAAVAVFIERAVEVVVMVFRDQQGDINDLAERRARQAAKKADDALAAALAAGDPHKDELQAKAEGAHKALDDAVDTSTRYTAVTKEFALRVSFTFGVLVSVAGVRALSGLVASGSPTGRVFAVADIVVTAALLAGGSEGVHRLANVYTSFTDTASSQLDAKNPTNNPQTPPPATSAK